MESRTLGDNINHKANRSVSSWLFVESSIQMTRNYPEGTPPSGLYEEAPHKRCAFQP